MDEIINHGKDLLGMYDENRVKNRNCCSRLRTAYLKDCKILLPIRECDISDSIFKFHKARKGWEFCGPTKPSRYVSEMIDSYLAFKIRKSSNVIIDFRSNQKCPPQMPSHNV